jgi:hypothetical protein
MNTTSLRPALDETASVDTPEIELWGAQTDMDWDDDSPLPPRRPKLFTPLTWTLAGLLAATGCFTLGAKLGHDHAPVVAAAAASRTGTRTGATGGGGAGFGRTGGTGGGGGGGAGTLGQVQLVDGNNIYVQDSSGNIIKVTPGPTAVVTINAPGTPADFKPGQSVVVQGTADANGNIANATSIAAVAAGAGRAAAAGNNIAAGTATGAGSTAPTATTAKP